MADLDPLLGVAHGPVPDLADAGPATATRTLMIDAIRQGGRYISGAAPYGYRVTHDQPHPNPGKATRGGRRALLRPDQDQAPILQEIVLRTLAGDGQTTLIHDLTRRAILPPTGRGPAGWTVQAISTILHNPRCTGYEFWHPYSVRRHPGLPPEAYQILVRSDRPAHPALVAIEDFLAVATMRALPVRPRPNRTSLAEPILLHRIRCAICGRTMSLSFQGRAGPVPMPTDARRPGQWSPSLGVPRRIPGPGRHRSMAAPPVRDVPIKGTRPARSPRDDRRRQPTARLRS